MLLLTKRFMKTKKRLLQKMRRRPGLLGSLLVGASFAKSFSMSLGIPLIEVNHMQAHLLCHFIEDNCKEKTDFPFLGINISGGHTQIVL